MFVYDSSEFVYIVTELCAENYLLVSCFYFLENVMSLISFSTSSFLYPLCFSLWISLIFMFSIFFLFEFVRR